MNFLKGVKRGFVSNFVDSSILEQPKYAVLGEGADYEERSYPAANWVMTVVREHVEEIYEDNGTMTSFFRLQKYVYGDNEEGVSTELTFPVLVRISYHPDTGAVLKAEMGLYIHPSRQDNPPVPKNKTLFIEKFPEMKVYARRFSGYAADATYLSEKDNLRECLRRDGIEGETLNTVSYAAGYDAPTKMFNRRNEVWLRIADTGEPEAEAEPKPEVAELVVADDS